jgi:hypothetical protein
VDVQIGGDIEGDCYKLVQASYDDPVNSVPVDTPLLDIHDTFGRQPNASYLPIKETQISFHLNAAVHAEVMERLLGDECRLGADPGWQ